MMSLLLSNAITKQPLTDHSYPVASDANTKRILDRALGFAALMGDDKNIRTLAQFGANPSQEASDMAKKQTDKQGEGGHLFAGMYVDALRKWTEAKKRGSNEAGSVSPFTSLEARVERILPISQTKISIAGKIARPYTRTSQCDANRTRSFRKTRPKPQTGSIQATASLHGAGLGSGMNLRPSRVLKTENTCSTAVACLRKYDGADHR